MIMSLIQINKSQDLAQFAKSENGLEDTILSRCYKIYFAKTEEPTN